MSYHKITIVGNLGRDPEMRYTPGGQAVTNFNVASNRQYTGSNGEKIKETVWFRISAWGRQAEICNQYLKTGSQVMIEGRMTPDKASGGPRVWTRQDGTPAASYEVTAERVVFLGGRGGGGGGGGDMGGGEYGGLPSEPDGMMGGSEDEIPF
ncbi:MAG: single-stranded DNA-binding protein [Anaerolineales bacterium]|nr:single-stranded DNA-binding protein [Anaerolineales bacterium]MCL4258082.1 single-stranded DNA-binding protein [Anaerolineales bacterium]